VRKVRAEHAARIDALLSDAPRKPGKGMLGGPLVREAQAAGKPGDIRPQVLKVRAEHAARIDALLNDAQRKRWKEMLGAPLDLGD